MTISPDQPIQEGLLALPKTERTQGSSNGLSQTTTVHTVQIYENLGQIAELYGVSVVAITQANKLTEQSVLYPGLRLLITLQADLEQSGLERQVSHLVQLGESLFAIAQKYGLTVSKLQEYNFLSDNAILLPGTKLDLVQKFFETSRESALKFLRPAPTSCLIHGHHRVKFGDQLSRIASLHGVSVQSLLSANDLGWHAHIYEGQKLVVPISHGPFDCPNLVSLEPHMFDAARTYFKTASELELSDFSLVVALCFEMQRSGLSAEFGTAPRGKSILLDLKEVAGIELMSVKQAITEIGFATLAEGSSLWEPSAWAWLREVRAINA